MQRKERAWKFNAIKNSDYCVEHLAFNQQVNFFFYYVMMFIIFILHSLCFFFLFIELN